LIESWKQLQSPSPLKADVKLSAVNLHFQPQTELQTELSAALAYMCLTTSVSFAECITVISLQQTPRPRA